MKAEPNLQLDIFNQTESEKEWYCHLFFIHRKKCLLFTHSPTLFSFFIADVRADDLRNFASLFRAQATNAFRGEGLTSTQIASLLDTGPDQMGKTANKSVIGSMNDLIRMWKYNVEDAGRLERINVEELNKEMNKVPMSYIGMESGERALKRLLKAKGIE
jgi:hypothetical protein